ncbi:hypothetical protein EV426DRAFT_706743 [Tirmania nivea]|nr:hypothetical protein EV426DRAFT_706743 [Tirmania nivea]
MDRPIEGQPHSLTILIFKSANTSDAGITLCENAWQKGGITMFWMNAAAHIVRLARAEGKEGCVFGKDAAPQGGRLVLLLRVKAWDVGRAESPLCGLCEEGITQNAAHLLSCSGVADGKGRSWEQIWEDPEWCEKLAEVVRG